MPLPFLVLGLGAAAGVLGVGGHLSAKDTNEKAQRISQDAQELYNDAKHSLELARIRTEEYLLELGSAKKEVLDNSMNDFLNVYDKIKNVKITEWTGLNELSKFTFDQQGAMQLREMRDIYSTTSKLELATVGMAAVSGLGSALSMGGTALAVGGLGMTPLLSFAGPAILFTAISADTRADENLEKANTMYAEAKKAVEEMKTSETLCVAISDRSEMFYDLLVELDGMFSECVDLLSNVIKKKSKRQFTAADFSEEELKLIAVTRSLAGAVKSVIDTPILTKEGTVARKSKQIYNEINDKLPDFSYAVGEIR